MEKHFSLRNGPEPADFRQKLKIVIALLLIIFSALLVRLWYLQVIKGEALKQRSENNSVRFLKIQPLRGLIMDKNGIVLADNRPSFDVLYMPNKGKEHEIVIEKLKNIYKSKSLELSYDQPFPKKVKPYLPVKLEKNVSMEKVAIVETNALTLPGIYVDVSPVRLYLAGEMMAPIIGYTGEISKEELEKDNDEHASGDVLGKQGVEKYLDQYIRGSSGAELVEVNVYDKEIKNLGRREPVPGYNVVLTIDADLQKAAWDAFAGKPGAAVALDTRDGSVLAMVSSPSFDPNLFNSGIPYEIWDKMQKNPFNPLSNKAISGQYPPGSTYKLIVAAAALEEAIIKPEQKIFCNGSFELGNRPFRCWKSKGHGYVDLHRAIVESCDVYFYTVGMKLGVDKIAKYAKLFGLGEATGIDLHHEKGGLVPTKEWKIARTKETWLLGETISISIGQGFNLVTPLQLVNAYSAFANGGTLWQPHLIKRIELTDGSIYKDFLPEKKSEFKLSKKTMDILGRALWGVVNEEGGKTGTSQVVGLPQGDKARREKKISAFQRDHALFVCFAPLKSPEIAIVVIAENAGHGGSVAAPIARKILDAYFEGKKKLKPAQVAAHHPLKDKLKN
jgi:penicillin-binding protein 2